MFANATTYLGIGATDVSNNAGLVAFSGIPATTIGFLAKSATNQVSTNGVAGGLVTSITTKILPLSPPVAGAPGCNVENGTSGWAGGLVKDVDPNLRRYVRTSRREANIAAIPITKRDGHIFKSDTVLVVSTNFQPSLQLAFNTFAIDANASTARI